MKPGIETEFISCPICGGRELAPLLRKDGWQVTECPQCQLAMINPRRKNALAIYESDSYFSNDETYYDYSGQKAAYQKGFRSKLKLISKYQPRRGRLLDVGAAYGFFMEEANKLGFEAAGVEPSPPAARHASRYGPIFQSSLAQVNTEQRFSTVCFIDSLEHFEDPFDALQKAWTLLDDSGIVAIMVPNIHSLFARVAGSRWHLLLPEEHLFYFTPKSVRLILKKAGFDVLHLGTGSYGRSAAELLHVILGRGRVKMPTVFERALKKVSFEINLGDIFVIGRKVNH